MRFFKTVFMLVLAGATLVTMPVRVRASSHREAPLITTMPKTDGTDFYLFRSYEPGRYHARHTLRRMRRRPMLVTAFWQQANLFPL